MERIHLIRARSAKGWTLREAAKRIGIDVNTLNRWEKGTANPRNDGIDLLCKAYGTTPEGLDVEYNGGGHALMVPSSPSDTPMTDNISSSVKQDLTARLMGVVWSWPQRNDRYEELQAQIYQATDDYSAIIELDLDQIITRRNALRSLVLLPFTACSLAQLSKALRNPAEDILIQCAAGIAACWYFRKGKELSLAFDALCIYIPALEAIVNASPTKHRKAAASLLVQCYILKGTLAKHLEKGDGSVRYLLQAIKYSDQSGNAFLRILSWRNLESAYYYLGQYEQALMCDEKAKSILDETKDGIPWLMHTQLHQCRPGQFSSTRGPARQGAFIAEGCV